MNKIPLSTLQNCNCLASEYPNAFLFEFDVMYKSYDYVSGAHKSELFLTTLNNAMIHWFMELGGNNIHVHIRWHETIFSRKVSRLLYIHIFERRDIQNDSKGGWDHGRLCGNISI